MFNKKIEINTFSSSKTNKLLNSGFHNACENIFLFKIIKITLKFNCLCEKYTNL